MITVAVEGPALAGKSTAIDAVLQMLDRADAALAHKVPCYVEWANSHGYRLPELQPELWEDQVRAVDWYLQIDEVRRTSAQHADLTLLDRSSWTLLAHTAALISLGLEPAPGGLAMVEAKAAPSRPDVVIYIDTPQAALETRAHERANFPELLVSSVFNSAFRQYFVDRAAAEFYIDGAPRPQTVARAVFTAIQTILHTSGNRL